jgi:hypothetical protein
LSYSHYLLFIFRLYDLTIGDAVGLFKGRSISILTLNELTSTSGISIYDTPGSLKSIGVGSLNASISGIPRKSS